MKLIATVLALTFALLLTGCVNRDRQDDTVRNDTTTNDTVVTDGTQPNDYVEDMTDPAANSAYDADGGGAVEPETRPDNAAGNTGNAVNDRNNGTVMDSVTDAADDVVDTTGDVARRVVDGAEDVADDVINGVDRAADNVENSVNRNR